LFVTMSSLSPRANYLLLNGQRNRESFLSVNHKLIRPKRKVFRNNTSALSAALITDSSEGGLNFILRLHLLGCGNASLGKWCLIFEDQLVVSSSKFEKSKKKLCGTNYPVM